MLQLSARFVISCVCFAILYGLARYYHAKDVLSKIQSYLWNASSTGISIILGLNIASALQEVAEIFRWKVLGNYNTQVHGGYPAKEVDLILQMGSY